jgi:hypothetical protein
MDTALVEKITRLVLLKLEEYSNSTALKGKELNSWNNQSHSTEDQHEFPPLTEEELEKWNVISSFIGLTKAANPSIDEHSILIPLTEEEMKIWKSISSSFGFSKNAKSSVEEQFDFRPLTDEELNKWSEITSSMERIKPEMCVSSEKGLQNAKVKFFRHHEERA